MADNKKKQPPKLGGPNGKGNPYNVKGGNPVKKPVKGKTNSRPYAD